MINYSEKLLKAKQIIDHQLTGGDVIIIIPPFYQVEYIPLGPYLLQALAKQHHFTVDILHLDMLVASIIGLDRYKTIQDAPEYWMLGERLFARSAYQLPALGHAAEYTNNEQQAIGYTHDCQLFAEENKAFDLNEYLQLETICQQFINEVIPRISNKNYPIIGCSIGFCHQVSASMAIFKTIKEHAPHKTTIAGGSYLDQENSQGLQSLTKTIDYIFYGESELSFIEFLEQSLTNKKPANNIIKADNTIDLNQLPLPNYHAYRQSIATILGNENRYGNFNTVWYETSRGCWWGEKLKCSFCGIHETQYRSKRIEKITEDLALIKKMLPDTLVFMADDIMPESYPKQFLGYINNQHNNKSSSDLYPNLGYQIKVNPDIHYLMSLRQANVKIVLPGVESFSSNALKKLKKGLVGRQNIEFIRNISSVGIKPQYNILWGFPEDRLEDYQQLLEIIHLIPHLAPPHKFEPTYLTKHAPYFDCADEYAITDLKYWQVYEHVLPKEADIDKLANYYHANFSCDSFTNEAIIRRIYGLVEQWQKNWSNRHTRQYLHMNQLMDKYIIQDTRGLNGQDMVVHECTEKQAASYMQTQPYQQLDTQEWALANKLALVLDKWYIPLATSLPELIAKFSASSIIHRQSNTLC